MLAADVQNTGKYGYQYGDSAHPSDVSFIFTGCEGPVSLSVSGYDIDTATEVEVLVDNISIGYLSRGRGNNKLNRGDTFAISATSINQHEVTFRQTRSFERWGVTNVLLSNCTDPDDGGGGDGGGGDSGGGGNPEPIPLSESADTTKYGHNYGTNQHRTEIEFTFQNTGVKQTLSVIGYDINRSDEVQVLLNDQSVGYLSTGRKRKLNSGDAFIFEAVNQIEGSNVVAFRQSRDGERWGVTQLQLTKDTEGSGGSNTPVPLEMGITDAGQYGRRYGGGTETDIVSFSFNRFPNDIYLSVRGFDIDTKKEVQVELNGDVIGHLTKGSDQSINGGDVYVLPGLNQIDGANTITFRQTKNGEEQWGVTRLQLIGCEYQVNGTAVPANSGTPTVIDDTTGTVIFANFFNSGAITDGTDRYVSVCVSEKDNNDDRFAHFTTDVGQDDNIQIKAYPQFIIGTKFGLVGETSFRPYPALQSTLQFEYPALEAVSSIVGLPAFANTVPDIDILLDIDEQDVFGSIRDVMLESWFYDTSANQGVVGEHAIDFADWSPFTALPPMDLESTPNFKAGDTLLGTLNNIAGAGRVATERNLLLEMMVHVGPLSPNDVSYNPDNPNPDRNPSRYKLTETPVRIGDFDYHIWYGETYLAPVVVYSRETNALGQSLLNLTEEGEINLDWNQFIDYTMHSLESQLAAKGVAWSIGSNSIFPKMRAATGAIGGLEFGIEPQTNGVQDEAYRATVRKFEVFIRGKNFGL